MPTDPIIMAIDPGGTTGYVIVRIPKPQARIGGRRVGKSTHVMIKEAMEAGNVRTAEIKGNPINQATQILRIAQSNGVRILIIEGFHLSPPLLKKVKTIDILLPVKVGWAVAALIEHLTSIVIVWQPSSSMTVITDERLRRWGLWVKGKDARSALKHLIVYLRGDSE